MALQAILAQQRRNRDGANAAANLGGSFSGRSGGASASTLSLRAALKAKSPELYKLFGIWDEDGNGAIDEKEFRRAVRMLGLKCDPDDFKQLCEMCDKDGSGDIDLDELIELLEEDIEEEPEEEPEAPRPLLIRCANGLLDILNTTSVQTVMYLIFVFIFQQLVQSLRMPEEFYLDRAWSAPFVDKLFDDADTVFAGIHTYSQVGNPSAAPTTTPPELP